jgi:transcriptional regulator with XRE-family HTH domain
MARTGFGKRFPTCDPAAVEALASNVRRLRKAKGWSQAQLAAEVDVEQHAVSLIENGRANPTIMVIESVAAALGVLEGIVDDDKNALNGLARGLIDGFSEELSMADLLYSGLPPQDPRALSQQRELPACRQD